MQSHLDEIHSAGFDVVAICVDPVEKNAEVAAKQGLTFPLLHDGDLKAIDAFSLRHVDGGFGQDIARPGVFIADSQGRIQWRRLTDNWRVRLRPAEILEALGEITSGAAPAQ